MTIDVLEGTVPPFFLVLRVDPALGTALDFAVGAGLIMRVGGARVQLTSKGSSLVKEIEEDAALMSMEREFLTRVGKLATEKRVAEVMDWRIG